MESRPEPPNLSIVVPVYRAAGALPELHRRLVATIESCELSFEIILVEDGGQDESWSVIEGIAATDPRVRGLMLSRNFGQHRAIAAGIDHARGDWTVVMDCDLQDRPEDIPRLFAAARDGFDIVIARDVNHRDSRLRDLTGRLFYGVFAWLSGYRVVNGERPFRLISRDAVAALREVRDEALFLGPLCAWIGFPTTYVSVSSDPRYEGRSSYSLRALLGLGLDVITSYSYRPLRASIWVGMTMAIAAIVYGASIVLRVFVVGSAVPGWASTTSAIFFVGGLLLANLGVVGLYIGRVLDEARGRPAYLVARRTRAAN